MDAVHTLYQLSGIRHKIIDQDLRMIYLKDVWGLEQRDIGTIEGMSQSTVSRQLKAARFRFGAADIKNVAMIQFMGEEIKMLMALPRTVINDTQLIAFVTDILGVYPLHPFFTMYNRNVNFKVAALAELGIQNRHIMKVYGKNQPTISMITKRLEGESDKFEIKLRYQLDKELKLEPQRYVNNFTLAGGR